MSNLEKYNAAFINAFGVDESSLEDLKYESVETWDSVGQMVLIAAIEDAFEIMFDMDEMINLVSYKDGIEILKNHNINI